MRGVGPQLPADLQAVEHGQHQVEHDEVGDDRLGLPQPVLAVGRGDDLEAFLLQVVGEHLAQRPLVLDDQEGLRAHGAEGERPRK